MRGGDCAAGLAGHILYRAPRGLKRTFLAELAAKSANQRREHARLYLPLLKHRYLFVAFLHSLHLRLKNLLCRYFTAGAKGAPADVRIMSGGA